MMLLYPWCYGCYILFYFIPFYLIQFILLHLDVIGNYVLRSYDVINLLCYGRWNSQKNISYINIIIIIFGYSICQNIRD